MGTEVEHIRVVVVSPGDVGEERAVVQTIGDELNRTVAAERRCRLSVWRWETDARPGLHLEGPQGLIDEEMSIEDADIVVGIFWKRFGTPMRDARSAPSTSRRVEAERCAPVLLEHRDRHRQDPGGVAVGRIVLDVDERGGAVVGHDRGHRVAAGVEVGGADVGGDRLGVAGPQIEEVAEERVRAGTDQLLGKAGRLGHEVEVKADGRARAVHGVPHVERRQDVEARHVRDRVGVVQAGTEGDEGAPVVPSQREALVAERTGERDDVGGHRALGVGRTGRVRGLVARAVAA